MFSLQDVQARYHGRVLAALTLLLSAQCGVNAQSAPTTPKEMLKWSMTKYAEMPTFQSDCNWDSMYNGVPGGAGTKRTFWYQKPNLFKVVTSYSMGNMVQTSVSDGSKLVGTPALLSDDEQNSSYLHEQVK